jgi:dTDP-4-dehydrorhamnose 3,5-epimerase
MRAHQTSLPGLMLIEPDVHRDERGFFVETYRAAALADAGIDVAWVQDNHARSARGVLRGMHFSVDPGQAKLVRCARGRILDVAVDLRRGSPAFGRWEAIELDDVSARQVYVPVGFAHGYYVLSEVADVTYKCSEYYDGAKERSIAWDDPDVGIAWPEGERVVSARDAAAPRLADVAAGLFFDYPG